MAETEADELMTCGHCGNVANCKVEAEYIYYAEGWADPCGTTWRLLQCPACTNIILTQVYFEGEDPVVEYDVTILYPPERTRLPKLPIEIAKEYEATLKVRRISANACAVLARRTLEAICPRDVQRDLK